MKTLEEQIAELQDRLNKLENNLFIHPAIYCVIMGGLRPPSLNLYKFIK